LSEHYGPDNTLERFRAELDVFTGPLDLLLYLVKQEEVDIFEVEVSRITDRYLAALRTMQFFDINVAADFLVVAATLMEMKSRTLLPPSRAEAEEEEEDPGVELVRRLLEYKQFKEAAGDLQERARSQVGKFSRPRPPAAEVEDQQAEALLEDLAVWDLMAAFAQVVQQTQLTRPRRIVRSDVPVSVYVEEALALLRQAGGGLDFVDFFSHERSRDRVIGMFLALLELVRRRLIDVEQTTNAASSIRITLRPTEA